MPRSVGDTIHALKQAELEAASTLRHCEESSEAKLEEVRSKAQQIQQRAEKRIQRLHQARKSRLDRCLDETLQEIAQIRGKAYLDEKDHPALIEALKRLSEELTS